MNWQEVIMQPVYFAIALLAWAAAMAVFFWIASVIDYYWDPMLRQKYGKPWGWPFVYKGVRDGYDKRTD